MIQLSEIEKIQNLSHSDWISIIGIIVGTTLSIVLFKLQQRLSDKQKIENRLRVEREIGKKLYDIHYNDSNSKIQLYNTKLLNSSKFRKNKRSLLWGFPYHAAELYSADFDGIEYVTGLEKWAGKKYYKIGVIDYEHVLGVRPEGDGSFNGTIFYVKPRLFQLNRYAIAYKSFRYYPIKDHHAAVTKPFKFMIRDAAKKFLLSAKYMLWTKWKHMVIKK